jgi:phenylalanine-4-hydroxylase
MRHHPLRLAGESSGQHLSRCQRCHFMRKACNTGEDRSMSILKDATQRAYSETDHDTWRRLIARQLSLVQDFAPQMYWEGFERLQLDQQRLPAQAHMSEQLFNMVGWRLSNAQDEYLKETDWFIHLRERHFPVTDYIRAPEDIEFTPLPDLFHEYFGHLAWMTLPRYLNIVDRITRKYLAVPEKERPLIANFWWFTTEFGLIRENGKVRPFGAGLLSSPGEFQYAMAHPELYKPFTFENATHGTSKPYAFHDEYFVIDGFEDLETVTADW